MIKSSARAGRAHGIAVQLVYSTRIEATNFALAADGTLTVYLADREVSKINVAD